jgi:hypothetical protein
MPARRPSYDKPYGAENYDQGALDDKQQEKLNQRKVIQSQLNFNLTILILF